jgi:ferredoxin
MDNRIMTKKTKKGKITINRERCKGCHICIETCPNEMIEVDETPQQEGILARSVQGKHIQRRKGMYRLSAVRHGLSRSSD